MRIKLVILMIFIVMILAGTVSAQEMVRRVGQSSEVQKDLSSKAADQAKTIVNLPPKLAIIGSTEYHITRAGPQDVQISVWVNDVKDLTNMDLEVGFLPVDGGGFPYDVHSIYDTPRDFGNLRVIQIDKGNLIDKSLFDSQTKSIDDDILACKPGDLCFGHQSPGPWHHETVQISFASSEGVSGQGNIAEITFTINVPPSQLQSYYVIDNISVKNAQDSRGNPIQFDTGTQMIVIPGNIMKGDGDGDGKVTTNDATAAIGIAVGRLPYNPVYDMNGDGKVDSTDVRLILKLTLVETGASAQGGGQEGSEQPKTSKDQIGLTPETDKGGASGGVSYDERIGSIPIQLPKPKPEGVGGKISSIPIQLP